MNVAVFGAAFDPPHLGHQQIAHYLIDEQKADQVWWVPVKLHPFGKQVTADHHRLAMIKLTIADAPGQLINEFELHQTGPSYSLKTLQNFKAAQPHDDFSFVIGSDNLAHFHKWDKYQELLKNFPVWVYPREGAALSPLYPGMTALRSAPTITVSSTEIRAKVEQRQSITGLVAPAVEQYIKTHHLYVT